MNILITSVGRRSYMADYFKEALGGGGSVHVANSSAMTPAFARADRHVVTPLIYSEEYIPFLLDYCAENKIAAIVSLFDIDLMVLAKHREAFQKIGVRLILSDESVIEKCNDKWKSFQYLRAEGFLVPETFICLESAQEALRKGNLSFPLVVKPRWGMGSLSVLRAENELELQVLYEKIKRDIFCSYLKYESVQNPEECVLIQQELSGQEYGLDVINDLHGEHVTTVVKKKYAMRAGETDCAMTVGDRELQALGKELGCRLGHIANLDVDVFRQEDKIYVLEMNARFGGGYPFSHAAGINLPLAIVRWLRGEEPGREAFAARENVLSHKDIGIAAME